MAYNYRDTNKFTLGDHLYYNAFAVDNPDKVKAIANTAFEALSPYYLFLDKAIKAEKEKGSYEIKWKKVPIKLAIRLRPLYQYFKLDKPKPYLLLYIPVSELKESKNRLIYDESNILFTFEKSEVTAAQENQISFRAPKLPQVSENIELNGKSIKYRIVEVEINKDSILNNSDDKEILIEHIETLENGWNVKVKFQVVQSNSYFKFQDQKLVANLYEKVTFEKLFDADYEIEFDAIGKDIHLKTLPKSKIIKTDNGTEFTWWRIESEKSEYAIQLIDDEDIDLEKPISEYFFDDSVEAIFQGKDNRDRIEIKSKKSEDKILILKQPYNGNIELDENMPIKISINIVNLQRQKEAIKLLNNSPVKNHKNLIKLFEKKRNSLWPNVKPAEVNKWYVLTDESYDGYIAQRNFVKKAISTNDFAFLEGPPGSGKTTVIIELVLQLIKRGFSVLLSASTHVAIDNVLERIKKYDIENIVEPLRIGDNARIDEIVKKFQIDNKIESLKSKGISEKLAEKITIDSANLVCGTTMGILQHPYIKNQNEDLPANPRYDYLIIDESSKTTFQEFLVPALHAKKWILVGDIKQLSPYIEQSHIIHNFKALVDRNTQTALRIVFETLYNNPNPYVLEVNSSEIKCIDNYLEEWSKRDINPYSGKLVSVLDGSVPNSLKYKVLKRINDNKAYLLGSDLLLIQEGEFEENKAFIPKHYIVILKNFQPTESFYFKQLYLSRKLKMSTFYRNINENSCQGKNPIDMMNYFREMMKEKSWAEEITWRMIRVYERRMLKNPNSYYENTFDLLKPIDTDNIVDRIYNMTLPSILESLQTGNGEKHRNSTTITEGFDEISLEQRHEVLDYQHRMHPDISKFSREEFYTLNEKIALKDGKNTEREWAYNRYNSRAVWIDVPKTKNDNDRRHQAEADCIISELNCFLNFAKTTQHPFETNWTVAIITFYRPQETIIRTELRKLCEQPTKMSRFSKEGVSILCYTVDKFQGMEADIVFLSMVRAKSIGFLDNINRLNVALTRARFQRVILGDISFFKGKAKQSSEELRRLAEQSEVFK